MTALHGLDLLAMGIYFIVLIGIGLRVARSEKEGGDSESFLAADRDMNLRTNDCLHRCNRHRRRL